MHLGDRASTLVVVIRRLSAVKKPASLAFLMSPAGGSGSKVRKAHRRRAQPTRGTFHAPHYMRIAVNTHPC